jgi:hypothetical protein
MSGMAAISSLERGSPRFLINDKTLPMPGQEVAREFDIGAVSAAASLHVLYELSKGVGVGFLEDVFQCVLRPAARAAKAIPVTGFGEAFECAMACRTLDFLASAAHDPSRNAAAWKHRIGCSAHAFGNLASSACESAPGLSQGELKLQAAG